MGPLTVILMILAVLAVIVAFSIWKVLAGAVAPPPPPSALLTGPVTQVMPPAASQAEAPASA